MKLDILAIMAHPDDAELSCGGTLVCHSKKGYKTGILDLTRGEMGTRGSAEQRDQEAKDAADFLGLTVRDNLEFKDSFFENDEAHQLKLIEKIRLYQPDIVISNAPYDRHPDHGRGHRLVEEAVFKAGLKKLKTIYEGKEQVFWRPKKLYSVIQSVSLEPDFFVDISDCMEEKMNAIKAYRSQFYDPDSKETETYISSPSFIKMIESRAQEYGHRIGVQYAEGFKTRNFMGVKSLYDLI